jgi:hypothetical protein
MVMCDNSSDDGDSAGFNNMFFYPSLMWVMTWEHFKLYDCFVLHNMFFYPSLMWVVTWEHFKLYDCFESSK